MSENTKNTTKNTLVEAENVALRVELDEANKKIKAIESSNRQDVEQRKTIAALTKNAAVDKKRIAELSAKQLTAEQITNLRGYDRLSAFSSEQSGKLSALTSKYEQATSRLENVGERFREKNERIEQLGSIAEEAKKYQKKYKKRMLTGIIAAAFFTAIIGGGSYYYVEAQLTPAETLSQDAAEAFKKYAPEYRAIVSEKTAQERERLRIASSELMAEKMNFDRDKPGWFSTYGMPLIYVIGGIIVGFLIGLGTILKLIK